ncbi:hypothetical protein I4U23_005821 [Adineta vaga]|nr:hypothetical protein I4U23_005821 [Adineta vaga]
MPSIRDIQFDSSYQEATFWMFLVYQLDGIGLEVPLRNAQLMSFVQPFHNRQICRNYMLDHNQKLVTLFAYSEDIEKWWNDHRDDIPFNVQEIYIFCDTSKDVAWIKTYTGRFSSKVKDTFIYDRLDEKILYYAIGFIGKLIEEAQNDTYDRLKVVRKNLCKALSKLLDEQ